jgi:hypothetical protein
VAIEQDGVVPVARDLDENERRPSRQPHDFALHAGNILFLAPGEYLLHGVFHVAVFLPVRIEMRGLVGNPDVLDQLGNDGVHPDLIDEFLRCLMIHDLPCVGFGRWGIISRGPCRFIARHAMAIFCANGPAVCYACGTPTRAAGVVDPHQTKLTRLGGNQ